MLSTKQLQTPHTPPTHITELISTLTAPSPFATTQSHTTTVPSFPSTRPQVRAVSVFSKTCAQLMLSFMLTRFPHLPLRSCIIRSRMEGRQPHPQNLCLLCLYHHLPTTPFCPITLAHIPPPPPAPPRSQIPALAVRRRSQLQPQLRPPHPR
jgi:hypothetical protein